MNPLLSTGWDGQRTDFSGALAYRSTAGGEADTRLDSVGFLTHVALAVYLLAADYDRLLAPLGLLTRHEGTPVGSTRWESMRRAVMASPHDPVRIYAHAVIAVDDAFVGVAGVSLRDVAEDNLRPGVRGDALAWVALTRALHGVLLPAISLERHVRGRMPSTAIDVDTHARWQLELNDIRATLLDIHGLYHRARRQEAFLEGLEVERLAELANSATLPEQSEDPDVGSRVRKSTRVQVGDGADRFEDARFVGWDHSHGRALELALLTGAAAVVLTDPARTSPLFYVYRLDSAVTGAELTTRVDRGSMSASGFVPASRLGGTPNVIDVVTSDGVVATREGAHFLLTPARFASQPDRPRQLPVGANPVEAFRAHLRDLAYRSLDEARSFAGRKLAQLRRGRAYGAAELEGVRRAAREAYAHESELYDLRRTARFARGQEAALGERLDRTARYQRGKQQLVAQIGRLERERAQVLEPHPIASHLIWPDPFGSGELDPTDDGLRSQIEGQLERMQRGADQAKTRIRSRELDVLTLAPLVARGRESFASADPAIDDAIWYAMAGQAAMSIVEVLVSVGLTVLAALLAPVAPPVAGVVGGLALGADVLFAANETKGFFDNLALRDASVDRFEGLQEMNEFEQAVFLGVTWAMVALGAVGELSLLTRAPKTLTLLELVDEAGDLASAVRPNQLAVMRAALRTLGEAVSDTDDAALVAARIRRVLQDAGDAGRLRVAELLQEVVRNPRALARLPREARDAFRAALQAPDWVKRGPRFLQPGEELSHGMSPGDIAIVMEGGRVRDILVGSGKSRASAEIAGHVAAARRLDHWASRAAARAEEVLRGRRAGELSRKEVAKHEEVLAALAGEGERRLLSQGEAAALQRRARQLLADQDAHRARSAAGEVAEDTGGSRRMVFTRDEGAEGGVKGRHPGCFVAGTRVLTEQGWRAIESLEVGERVLAFEGAAGNTDGGQVGSFGSGNDGPSERAARTARGDVLATVTNTFVRTVDAVIAVDIAYPDGAGDTLVGTPNHPFWVPAEGRYVALEELAVGAVLRTVGGGEAVVVGRAGGGARSTSTTWRWRGCTASMWRVLTVMSGTGMVALGVCWCTTRRRRCRRSGCRRGEPRRRPWRLQR